MRKRGTDKAREKSAKLPHKDTSLMSRQRHNTFVQEQFLRLGLDGLDDQTAIELLLSLNCPAESKALARKCLKKFGSLRELVAASPSELEQAGLCRSCIVVIKLLYELPARILKQRIIERSVYASSQEIFNYLYHSMRDLKKEVFKVIYLNKRDQIIDIVDLFEGTLDIIPIRPRDIVDSAIKHNASALLFVHNHPTGDPTPSQIDKRLTRDLVFMGNILQIMVLDHIIIGDSRYFSFADAGLIQQYEDDFLNIRIKCI